MGKLVKIYASERGASHIRENKPLQDFSFANIENIDWKSLAYAVVSDGHGGKKYFRSAYGSHLAVNSVINVIKPLFREKKVNRDKSLKDIIKSEDKEAVEELLKHLCGAIILRWRESVIKHCAEHPLSEAEKQICLAEKMDSNDEEQIPTFYGSTLIVAVYLQKLDFWFALQIGDGACFVIRDDGTIFSPIKEDERLGFGMTTSLCGESAINDFYFEYGFEKINGMAVMTDGFSDSFTKEKLEQFVLQDLYVNTVANSVESETQLKKFLPSLSERGSGDDVSIAAFFDTGGKKAVEIEIERRVRLEVQQAMQQIATNTAAKLNEVDTNVDTFIASMSESVKKKSETLLASKRRVFVFAMCIGLVAGIIIGVLAYKYLLRKHTELELQSAIEQIENDVTKIQDVHILENSGTILEDDVAADDAIDNTVNEIEIGSEILDIGENEPPSTDNEILPVVTDESHAVDNSETENVQ